MPRRRARAACAYPISIIPADGSHEEHFRAVAHRRVEAARVSDVFSVDEDVDVRTHLAQLGDHAVTEPGAFGPQRREGRRERTGGRLDANLLTVAREPAQR